MKTIKEICDEHQQETGTALKYSVLTAKEVSRIFESLHKELCEHRQAELDEILSEEE